MRKLYSIIPTVIAGIILTGIFSAIAEDITLTTYYPAPYGEYEDLIVNGQLGIGLTTPSYPLHVQSLASSHTVAAFQAAAGVGNYAEVRIGTDAVHAGGIRGIERQGAIGSNGDIVIFTQNEGEINDAITVKSNGSVGIGTTDPLAKLHINNSGQECYMRITENDEVSGLDFGFSGTTSSAILWNSKNSPMRLATNNTEQLRITSTGNVGIGTTDPGTNKLEVVGGPIKATDGLIIETRTDDPSSPAEGQIWLRTDL